MSRLFIIIITLICMSGCSSVADRSVPLHSENRDVENRVGTVETADRQVSRLEVRIDKGLSALRLQTLFNQLYDNTAVGAVRTLNDGTNERSHLEVLLKNPTKLNTIAEYLRSKNVWITGVTVSPVHDKLIIFGSAD